MTTLPGPIGPFGRSSPAPHNPTVPTIPAHNATGQGKKANVMSKYERRVWFDELCELKSGYEAAPATEREATCTIAEAIDELIWLLDEPLIEETVAQDGQSA
jgi:hypothetical protein